MDKVKLGKQINVYKPSRLKRFGLILGAGFLALLFIPPEVNTQSILFTIICALPVIGVMIWVLVVSTTQIRLVVYENGLVYQRGSQFFIAEWDNLSHFIVDSHTTIGDITERNSRITFVVEVVLHQSIKPSAASGDKILFGENPINRMPLSAIVKVPLQGNKVNITKFTKTHFGRDLLHYAPHLFEKEK